MNKTLFAVALMTAAVTPAMADSGQDRGAYLVGIAGQTTNISNVDSGTSLSGLIGYRFNSVLAVEGGMVLLAEKANYTVPPVGYTGVGSTYTSTSLSGAEAAAKLSLPLTNWFAVFARAGFTSMSRSNTPSPAEVEVSWKGSTYGVGAQITLPYEFAIGGNRMRIGFRAGINKYNLQDVTGTLTETPSNTYVAGVILF
jgi:hypothetical protein